ncbi:hypothetical protein UlMin_000485 [Ulmus minor]
MGKTSKTLFLTRANKLLICFSIFFVVIILIIYSDSVLLNDEANYFQIKSAAITRMPLRSMKEEVREVGRENTNPFRPPFNLTEQERIGWFQRKLPEFEIFKSDSVTKQFHSRILQFLGPQCEVRVFMTWISPARLFGSREILTMESLFKAHPNGCLVILSRTMDSVIGYRILKPLIDQGFHVQAVTPDLSFLFKETPAETWLDELKTGKKDPGEIPLPQNLSNLMRLAVLYKYGGIYLDTDIIILKPLNRLRNTIGAQSLDVVSRNWTRLNNAVLIFDMNHPLLFKFIEEFAMTFDGKKWGHNGPYMVSRVVERLGTRPGFNFTILPPMGFYPVKWTKIDGLFRKPKSEGESRWVKAKLLQLSEETYGVHLWNRQSNRLLIEEGSVMGNLISDHCVICKHVYNS